MASHYYLLFKIILFIFGCAGSLLLCRLFLVVSVGYSLVAACGLLVAVASLVAQPGLWGMWVSEVVARGLNRCSSWALEQRLSSCGAWA